MAVDILVTGAAGVLGLQIVSVLRSAGYRVMACGRRGAHGLDAVWDVSHQETPDPEVRPRVVVHAAARMGSYRQPLSAAVPLFEANVTGTLRVARWCESRHVERFVLVSGAIVYGRWDDSPKSETDLPDPWAAGPYAVSKWCSEQAASLIRNGETELTILRLSSLYGSGYVSGLPQRLLREARHDGTLALAPPLDDAFDLLHVADAARTVRLAVESEAPGLWNVGSGELTTVHRLGEVCARQGGAIVGVSDISPERPRRILNWVDDGKARRELGHVNELTVDAGVEEIARGLA